MAYLGNYTRLGKYGNAEIFFEYVSWFLVPTC